MLEIYFAWGCFRDFIWNAAQRGHLPSTCLGTAKRTQLPIGDCGPLLAGVEFIDENGGGPGIRLRKPALARALVQPTDASALHQASEGLAKVRIAWVNCAGFVKTNPIFYR